VAATRQAISPRLAIRTFWNIGGARLREASRKLYARADRHDRAADQRAAAAAVSAGPRAAGAQIS